MYFWITLIYLLKIYFIILTISVSDISFNNVKYWEVFIYTFRCRTIPLTITLVIWFIPDFVVVMGIKSGIMVRRSETIVCLWDSYRGQVQKKWSPSSVAWTFHEQFLYCTMLQLYRCWFRPDIFIRIQAKCMELTPHPIRALPSTWRLFHRPIPSGRKDFLKDWSLVSGWIMLTNSQSISFLHVSGLREYGLEVCRWNALHHSKHVE